MKPRNFSNYFSPKAPYFAVALVLCQFASQASATTFVWTGAAGNTNLNNSGNWSPTGLPASIAGDTGQFNGTAAGNLVLGVNGPSAGTNPWNVSVTAAQDSSVTLNPPNNTGQPIRLYDIIIEEGAFENSDAAFSLGNGTVNTYVYLGNGTAPYTSNTFTNNSAATALIQSDVRFGSGSGTGSAGSRIVTFNGTGSWNVTAPLGIGVTNGLGSIGVVKNGPGTLSLGGANTFTDGLVMEQGKLNLNSTAPLGAAGSIFTFNGGTLDNTSGGAKGNANSNPIVLNTDVTFATADSITTSDLGLGSGAVSLGTTAGTSRTFNTLGSAVLTLSGVVSDGTTVNSIVKQGSGGLKLDAANAYTGGTTLADGFLHIGNNSALGAGPVTVTGGGFVPRIAGRNIANSISLAADFTIGQAPVGNQMNFSGTINLGGVNRTINVAQTTQALDSTISGVISNGGLNKSDGGTLVLSGKNTFAGPTTVSQGTLILNNAQPIDSSSAVTVNGSGAKLVVTGPAILPQPVTLTQGTVDGDGTIASLTVADNVSNILTNGNGGPNSLTIGSLTLQGAASLNITKNGPYTGRQLFVDDLVTSGTAPVVVTVTSSTGVWDDNSDYNLIDYTNSYASAIDASHFTLTPLVGLNPSQSATLVNTGSAIVVRITTQAMVWTGATDSNWTVGGPKNFWENDTAIEFANGKSALFDETASLFDVNIAAEVRPSSTIFTNNSFDYTLSSTAGAGISTGSLTKNGFAKLTVNNTNSYPGTTRITGGILEIKGSIPNTESITIASAGSLVFDPAASPAVYATPISNNGALIKNGDGALTLSGARTDTGSVTVNAGSLTLSGARTGTGSVTVNAGSLTLSGADTGTGAITLNSGTLAVTATSALSAGPGALVLNGGSLDNTSGGPLVFTTARPQTWGGDFTFTGSNNFDLGTGTVTLSGDGDRVVTVGGAGDILTVGEIRSATQGLRLTGGGTLVATSIGSFNDASKIGGTLTVDAGTTLQISRSTGDSLTTTGDFVAGGLAGTGTITSGASATERSLQIIAATDHTFGGTIANGSTAALALNKQGTGTLTLTGASSYTGPTVIGTGIINVRNNNALGASRVRILTQTGGLQLEGGVTLPPTVTFLTSNDGSGPTSTGYAIANISGDNTIAGVITMTQGAGFTRIQSDSGSLTLAGNITSDQNRSLVLHGASTGANTVSGVLSNGTSGKNGITKTGTGLWILTAENTYTGETIVTDGTLQLGNGITDGTIAASSNVVNNASLVYNWISDHTAGYVISGTGAVVKNGAGTATLTGANTYTGTTTVNAGQLAVTGSSIADTGTVIINGGKVNLTGSETVAQLFFGGVQQPAGSYTAADSGTHFSGSGTLIVTSGPGGASGFATWASANGATGQSASDDHDNDGVANGVEFFLGATGSSFTAVPSVVTTAGVRTVTWPKSASFTGTYEVQVSSDLGSWTVAPGGSVIDNGTTVVFTFPAGPAVRFVRLTVKPS